MNNNEKIMVNSLKILVARIIIDLDDETVLKIVKKAVNEEAENEEAENE